MATPRTPNQKKRYAALNKRLAKYMSLVQRIYDTLSMEAANIVTTMTDFDADSEHPFRFKDYPLTKSRVNDLLRFFSHDMQALIYAGTTDEWKQSNLVQDLLASDVLKVYGMQRNGERVKRYYQPNNDALKAFQRRKDKGMTVSQKIWNQSYNFKREMEYAISSAIEKGQSAITLSKRISKYLHDFPSLQTDYKEKYGTATDCQDCEYRSIRLARSEINMAYRTAEQTRWQQMDFIKGYEIKLSHSHPRHDVCDELVGIYPKWFKWTGWHPCCTDYCVPIVMTDDEWYSGKGQEINDVPQNYKDWCIQNSNRIIEASERGTLPYFIRDNYEVTVKAIESAEVAPVPITMKDIDFLVSQGIVAKESKQVIFNILSSDSPDVAQHRIHTILSSGIEHSVFQYAELYKDRNPEVNILLASIERLGNIDETTRIKTINKLKSVCAEECRKDLVAWGYVDEMTFRGIEKNFTLSSKQTKWTKKGIPVEIPEVKMDIIVFRDKNGVDFAYPIGATEEFYSAFDASTVVESLPPYLKKGIKRVTFVGRPNPFDVFWKQEYENPNHVSMASDGGKVTFYMTPKSKWSFKGYISHEAGHIIDGDSKHRFSASKGWRDAVAKDDELYIGKPVRNRVTKYAMTNDSEDFAECMSEYIRYHDFFKEAFPNRAAFIRQMAQKLSGHYRRIP